CLGGERSVCSAAMTAQLLDELGIANVRHGASWGEWIETEGEETTSINPATEQPIASVRDARIPECQLVLAKASERFESWREVPAPLREEVIRQLGERLRAHKHELGELISVEVGKIRSEGLGEVQEMIDICDFAVGLSRQLYGLSMHSERTRHR